LVELPAPNTTVGISTQTVIGTKATVRARTAFGGGTLREERERDEYSRKKMGKQHGELWVCLVDKVVGLFKYCIIATVRWVSHKQGLKIVRAERKIDQSG
jgi:hypothetical protein